MPDRSRLSAFSEDHVTGVVEKETALALSRFHGQRQPRAVLLAGQPGAGKTRLSSLAVSLMDGDAAFINADDYRRYHPNYRTLYTEFGSDCVGLTGAFSGAVTECLIQRLSDSRFNLVIEGAGRTVDVPRRTAELLTAKGYTVELGVIAARPEVSLCSTLLRFYQMNEGGTIPRSTAVPIHDEIVAALPGNLDTLTALDCISRLRIWDRNLTLLFDSAADAGSPPTALQGYWNRPWTSAELEDAWEQVWQLRGQEARYSLGQGTVVEELARRLGAVEMVSDQ